MNKELTNLAKNFRIQKNERCKLNSILRRFETESSEKLSANSDLKLVIEGFRSTVHFDDKKDSDSKILTEHIKAHMGIMKRTPLVGQELMGLVDNVARPLNFKLDSLMLNKLGHY